MNNTGVTMLSILIPTIPERSKMFYNLKEKAFLQCHMIDKLHPSLGNVEVIWENSKAFLDGGLSIGKKRQSLVKQATGRYLCFLDDDEDIAMNYMETLLRLCNEDKDVCTFRNLTKTDTYWCVVDMGLGFLNEEANPDSIVKRSPWHICPVRSEYAKRYEFPDTNYAEDWNWMERVLSDCKTEAKSNKIIHCYSHSRFKSESDKIINAGYK